MRSGKDVLWIMVKFPGIVNDLFSHYESVKSPEGSLMQLDIRNAAIYLVLSGCSDTLRWY